MKSEQYTRVIIDGLNDMTFCELKSIIYRIVRADDALLFTTFKQFILPMPSQKVPVLSNLIMLVKGVMAWGMVKVFHAGMELEYWTDRLNYNLWLAYSQRFKIEIEASSKDSLSYQGVVYPDWLVIEGCRYQRTALIIHADDGLPILDGHDFKTVFVKAYSYSLAK